MTDIKARGFENSAQLREHLAELDEEAPAEDPDYRSAEFGRRDEIAELREEVARLRRQLASRRDRVEPTTPTETDNQPALRFIATLAATFVIGRLARVLRLGAIGAAATPLIATHLVNRSALGRP
jgi:hypothetical protein